MTVGELADSLEALWGAAEPSVAYDLIDPTKYNCASKGPQLRFCVWDAIGGVLNLLGGRLGDLGRAGATGDDYDALLGVHVRFVTLWQRFNVIMDTRVPAEGAAEYWGLVYMDGLRWMYHAARSALSALDRAFAYPKDGQTLALVRQMVDQQQRYLRDALDKAAALFETYADIKPDTGGGGGDGGSPNATPRLKLSVGWLLAGAGAAGLFFYTRRKPTHSRTRTSRRKTFIR